MRTVQITPTAKAMTGRKTRSENSKREVEPQSIVRRNVHRPSDEFAVLFWPPTHPQISRTRHYFGANLGANTWANNHTPSENSASTLLPSTHQNRFGGSFGGPLP